MTYSKFLIALALILFCHSASAQSVVPIIFAPSEIKAGEDLIGWVFSPKACLQVEIRLNGKMIWYSDKSCEEEFFSVRVPYGTMGFIDITAIDDNGNISTKPVNIL